MLIIVITCMFFHHKWQKQKHVQYLNTRTKFRHLVQDREDLVRPRPLSSLQRSDERLELCPVCTIQQTSSKCIQNSVLIARRLLDVSWIV